ncbi:MAG: hypothetical protein QOD93_5344 [Acetobacteraceae bacterium]|jgi:hypothetical protein|nr:hypothetical protein [Acetobacteraceae bacterium]MEA3099775.1 hypothetical protein [Caballeronia mineralivorans]
MTERRPYAPVFSTDPNEPNVHGVGAVYRNGGAPRCQRGRRCRRPSCTVCNRSVGLTGWPGVANAQADPQADAPTLRGPLDH